jgi:hypothetical protein
MDLGIFCKDSSFPVNHDGSVFWKGVELFPVGSNDTNPVFFRKPLKCTYDTAMYILNIFFRFRIPSCGKLFWKTDQFCTTTGCVADEYFRFFKGFFGIFPGTRDLCATDSDTIAPFFFSEHYFPELVFAFS